MNNFKVVSYNLDNSPESYRLIESCNRYGYDLSFIGQGHGFRDFRQLKLDLLIEEISKVKQRFVMYTDGLDSWFLRDDILNIYKKYYNNKVVISGNRDMYPVSELYNDLPESPTSFKYTCSSQFMGETMAVLESLNIIRELYGGYVDQEGWNLYINTKPVLPEAVIDYECRLFLNMTQVEENELDSEFRLAETSNIPASIHFGGPKGSDPNYIKMMNLYERWLNG